MGETDTPDRCFNEDQTPLPFAIDRKTTYEEPAPKGQKKDHKVWVSQPSNELEKRQCTLQICFSPVKDKCRVAIIFRVEQGNVFLLTKKQPTTRYRCVLAEVCMGRSECIRRLVEQNI